MSFLSVPTRMSFFGMGPVTQMDLQLNTPTHGIYGLGEHLPLGYIAGTPEVRMSLTFMALNPESLLIHRLTHTDIFTLSRIGDMDTCHYCGFMLAPGSAKCHRCGGDRRTTIRDSKYDKFGRARVDAIDVRWQRGYRDLPEVHLDMSFIDSPTFNYTSSDDLFSGWFTTYLQDGWICKFCNGVVKDPAIDCPNCGGGRLPFSDLDKMRHNCLYCGRPVQGNTVCQGCGATDNGYSIWMPRLDWN